MFHQRLASVDAGHVGQNEAAQFGIFDERRLLQCRDSVVMDQHHVVICERITRLVVYRKTGVELEHVEQLKGKKKRNVKNQ